MGGSGTDVDRILPSQDEEPTTEQLSALSLQLQLGSCLVDFASWTSHNDRFLRTVKFKAMIVGPNGTIQLHELKGPADFAQWLRYFMVSGWP